LCWLGGATIGRLSDFDADEHAIDIFEFVFYKDANTLFQEIATKPQGCNVSVRRIESNQHHVPHASALRCFADIDWD
jgi:hypothetical protein